MVEGEIISFPVDVLGAIKSMFIRSIGNPNAFKYTMNKLLIAYIFLISMIFIGVIIVFLSKYFRNLFKENKKNKKNVLNMKTFLLEQKRINRILKYPIIGTILIGTCWIRVSLFFWLFGLYKGGDVIRETLPNQEGRVLGVWSLYSLFIFIIAGCFIGLSFGNKMLRNTGILIYALGILFILFGFFLDSGVIINDLPNFTV